MSYYHLKKKHLFSVFYCYTFEGVLESTILETFSNAGSYKIFVNSFIEFYLTNAISVETIDLIVCTHAVVQVVRHTQISHQIRPIRSFMVTITQNVKLVWFHRNSFSSLTPRFQNATTCLFFYDIYLRRPFLVLCWTRTCHGITNNCSNNIIIASV